MKIEKRLLRIKNRINNIINLDTLDEKILELQFFNPVELVNSGFMDKTVKWIMDPKHISRIDIIEYFQKRSVELTLKELGPVFENCSRESVGFFIYIIKTETVFKILKKDLLNYIEQAKNIKTNNSLDY
jgi:hypothetical protein